MAELVAVIVVIGVLSIIAMSHLSGSFARTRGVYDELLSQVQYARKVAIAHRRPVFVRLTGAQSILCYEASGGCTGVSSPSGESPFTISAPAGVAISSSVSTIQFDGLGRYPAAAQAVVTVTGEGSLQFTVEHETGYVRP